nr:hypothetical protein HK105_004336 [Polyrhizophydium stewartii]
MARLLEALKQLELHIVTAHPTLSRDLARMRNVFVHRRFKAFLGPHKKMPDVFVYMELVGSSIRLLDMVAKVVEIAIEPNEDIDSLCYKIQNFCTLDANELRISPGRMATNIIFDRTDRISDLLAKYPSSQNKPWASWTSSTRRESRAMA